jgi:hypothetical protein
MFYLLLKVIITGLVVAGVSEIAKRSSLMAAVLASLPLTSLLALIWLYFDTSDVKAAADLSTSIFWMVLPSLFFFIAFPLLVKSGFKFYPALLFASILMIGVYWGYVQMLKRVGVNI